jgi:hypothetical protein
VPVASSSSARQSVAGNPGNISLDWRPLIASSGERAAVRVAVAAIARDLRDGLAPSALGVANAETACALSQAALFFAYLGMARGRAQDTRFAWSLVDRAIGLVAEVPMDVGLDGGFCDVGWTVEHLLGARARARGPRRRLLEAIDEAALSVAEAPHPSLGYDLLHGLVGLGVYFLEGLPHAPAVRGLEHVVDRLHEAGVSDASGTGWRSRPATFPTWLKRRFPRGLYDFGLAHGNPGVLALLAASLRAGVRRQRCAKLLSSAVPWLLAQRQPDQAESRFASRKGRLDDRPAKSRLAWCYGDLGPAVALFAAAGAMAKPAWSREARALMNRCTRRAASDVGVLDATVCHGAAGLAHIYHRIARCTGDVALQNEARSWLRRTLELRRVGEYVGGYAACCTSEASDAILWRGDLGLLTGASGVGLVLLACSSSVPPRWDRRLLLS